MPCARKPSPITVVLPDLPSVPERFRGKPHKVSSVLRDGHGNAKQKKSIDAGLGFYSFGVSLSPADTSGRNLCPRSSPGCRDSCLYKQGRGTVLMTSAARIACATAFDTEREWFGEMLRWELRAAQRRCEALGLKAAVRLNVLSDIAWEKTFPWLFTEFPSVRYYDYSKIESRVLRSLSDRWPPNYGLTFSRSEENEADCLEVLAAGGTVAVVFAGPLPATWMGWRVVDGDRHDLRFLDEPYRVIGLTPKGRAVHDRTGFVVRPHPAVLADGSSTGT